MQARGPEPGPNPSLNGKEERLHREDVLPLVGRPGAEMKEMSLCRHAGAVVRTEGREHLVTARDAAAAGAGRGRVLVRLCSCEDLVHHAGDRVAPEADVNPESAPLR